MGWLFSREWGIDKRTIIQHLIKGWDNEKSSGETIAHSIKGNVLWAVCQVTRKDESGEPFSSVRFIMCYLLAKDDFGNDDKYWGYKDIDESMGPHYYTCPLSYLKLANPCFSSNSEFSKKWREGVIQYNASLKKKKQLVSSLRRNMEASAQNRGSYVVLSVCNSPSVNQIVCRSMDGRFAYGSGYKVPYKMIGESKVVLPENTKSIIE